MRGTLLKLLGCLSLFAAVSTLAGCALVLPEVSHQPVVRNPFPQLSKVAVAPCFNHSDERTVAGRDFAMSYFSELQQTPGFEVVPLGVVEEAIMANRVDLSGPGEARRLAEILGVDAVVVGAVTEYTPYYPPRCGLRVEWYTANPGYHAIPAGYGLPWNTPEEEYIPDSLVYESQMELARAQMATQAPDCDAACETLPPPPSQAFPPGTFPGVTNRVKRPVDPFDVDDFGSDNVSLAQATEELPPGNTMERTPMKPTPAADTDAHASAASSVETESNGSIVESESFATTDTLPPNWPSEACFVPAGPRADCPSCVPHAGPVLKHTRVYNGTDPDFTQALESYVYFRNDKRFGGWENYLQRSEDFVRFCCHMHISEMLSARGGSHKTRVVWRWPENR